MTESQIREIVRHEVAMLLAEEEYRRSIRGRVEAFAKWLGGRLQRREVMP